MNRFYSDGNFPDDFKRLRLKGWEILIRKNLIDEEISNLISLLQSGDKNLFNFDCIPSSQHSRIRKCQLKITNGSLCIYIKQHLCRSISDLIRNSFNISRARNAFFASVKMHKKGFDVPPVLGLFEKRTGPYLSNSILITEYY